MSSTYTVVTMPVTRQTYVEIRRKLEEAGYAHAIDGNMLDMTHVCIIPDNEEPDSKSTVSLRASDRVHAHALQNVFAEIRELVNDASLEITADTNLRNLPIDSLGHIEIVMAIEDEFAVEIDEDKIERERPKTIRQILVTAGVQLP